MQQERELKRLSCQREIRIQPIFSIFWLRGWRTAPIQIFLSSLLWCTKNYSWTTQGLINSAPMILKWWSQQSWAQWISLKIWLSWSARVKLFPRFLPSKGEAKSFSSFLSIGRLMNQQMAANLQCISLKLSQTAISALNNLVLTKIALWLFLQRVSPIKRLLSELQPLRQLFPS